MSRMIDDVLRQSLLIFLLFFERNFGGGGTGYLQTALERLEGKLMYVRSDDYE